MHPYHTKIYVFCLLLILSAFNSPASATEKQTMTMKQIIEQLKKEVKTLEVSGDWPDHNPTYDKSVNLNASPKDIVKQLSKRIDKNPVIDAYVKYQLCSFLKLSDYKEINTRELYKIAQKMPFFLPRKPITPQMIRAWEALDKQTNPSKEVVHAAKEAYRKYQDSVDTAMKKNKPIIEYHKLMNRRFPSTSAMRGYIKLVTLEYILLANLRPSPIIGSQKNKYVRHELNAANFFSNFSRVNDLSKGVENLLRAKIRDCTKHNIEFVHEPKMKRDKNHWKAGFYKDTSFHLQTLDRALTNSLLK